MKIAIVVSTFPKLSETFILSQITGLIDMGHEVEIFAEYPNEKEFKVHPDVEKYRLLEKTTYFTTPENKALRLLKGIYIAAANLKSSPATVLDSLNFMKFGKKAVSLKILYILEPFLGKEFDIIHCHFGINGALAIYLKDLGFKAKYITSFHGYDVNSLPKQAGKAYYSRLFSKGDLFTANTVFTLNRAAELGCDTDKIEILPVGLDTSKFTFKPRSLRPKEPVKFLTIGRLVEKKGHEYAIKAFAKVIRKHPNIIYLIAGDGPLKGKLKRLAYMTGVIEHVGFLNEIKDDEARNLYMTSHIFVLPSITTNEEDREGQALVLQEAQATGMPVISTLHNGIPEGVIDGRSAFLVPEKDIDALAGKMEYLITNQDVWGEMGAQGRRFVEKKYDIKGLNAKLLDIYQKLCAA